MPPESVLTADPTAAAPPPVAAAGNEPAAPAPAGNEPAPTPNGETNWMSDLSDDNRAYVERVGFKDLESALTHGRNAEKFTGMDKSKLMAAPEGEFDPSNEDWQGVLKAMGRPDAPDGYGDVPQIEGLENMPDERLSAINAGAHELGLNPQQRNGVYSLIGKMALEEQQADQAAAEKFQTEGLDALKAEKGLAYEPELEAAKALVKSQMGDEFSEALVETGLGNDPRLIAGFMKIAKQLSEPGKLAGEPNGGSVMTPGEAAAELAKHEQNHDAAIYDKNHAQHAWAVQRRSELIKFSNPPAAK